MYLVQLYLMLATLKVHSIQKFLWLLVKIWMLNVMYLRYPKWEITLWCDGCTSSVGQKDSSKHGKRKRDEIGFCSSKRQEKEDEVDTVFKDLKEKHCDEYDILKLSLWARMISSSLHDDYETPPNIPAFQGNASKKCWQQNSLLNAISGATVAFVDALNGNTLLASSKEKTPNTGTHSMSPSNAVELRTKNFEQLRYLQQLLDDKILTEKEYSEQKQNIVSMLSKL